MIFKLIHLENFDIDGNKITVITCESCGNQVKKEDKRWLSWNDLNVRCCNSPSYRYGVFVPVLSDECCDGE